MGRQGAAEIEGDVLEVVPQTGLMEGADRPRGQPGGDEQNEQAGPFEEFGQVQLHPAPVNHHAQHDGGRQAEHRADRRRGAHVLLESRQQEEHRLQPFARHGEEHHRHQRPTLPFAGAERLIDRPFQMHLDRLGHFAHPEHHIGEDHHRHHRDDAFEQLLLLLRELAGGFIDEDAERQTQRRGDNHADPHRAQPLAALRAFQVAGDQADDQRGLQPFTEHDKKGNEHK